MASTSKTNETTSGEHVALKIAQTDSPQQSEPVRRGFCEDPEALENFLKALDGARGARLLIVIKGHPDPDSIASTIAHRHFANHFDIDAR